MTDFDIEVKLDLTGDGVFDTDITSYVLARDGSNGIDIRRGGSPESGLSDPGTCDFQLNNRDGRFSPRNPNSPYHGQIGRMGTLMQVGVKGGDTYLHTLNTSSQGASTPDSAGLSIVGDIDIRFDATLENWFAAGGFDGTAELCGKGNFAAGQRAWILMIRNDLVRFEWSADGTNVIQVDSTTKPLIPLSRRLALRVTLDVDNGAAGNTVTFYTSDSIDGTWTQLGEPVVTAGVTSINNDTQALNVGRGWPSLGFDSAVGHIHAFELRNGIGGALAASPDFRVQADGATSFADAQGNTWTRAAFPDTNITDLDIRFTGEMLTWPNRWDTSGQDIWVDAKAKGILRRLDAGQTTLKSALTRQVPSYGPIAYWPMEDGTDATRFASPIAGVRPLSFTNMTLSSDATLGGSDALPVLSDGSTLQGPVPAGPNATGWHTEFVFNLPTLPASNSTLVRFATTGSARYWSVRIRTGNVINLLVQDADGTSLLDFDVVGFDDLGNRWIRVALRAEADLLNIDWTVAVTRIGEGEAATTYSDTLLIATAGRISGVSGGQPYYGAGTDGMTLGHISVWDTSPENDAYTDADDGWRGERAGVRVDRLSSEEGIEPVIHGWTSETERMGPQGPSTFLNLLRDAADADEGLLTEARESFKVKFVGLASLTNQEPTVTITYPDHIQPGLQPEPDDLNVENDVTVSRRSGSSGRVEISAGPLSVNAPPDGVNRYEVSYELDIYSDERTDDHAGWKAHLGSWDEERYSDVPVWVSAHPALQGDLTLLDVGTVLRITNEQNEDAKLPPGDIDLLIKGYTEFLNQKRWEFSFNGVPYGPYRVGVVEDSAAVADRLDTSGSELQDAVTDTGTEMIVYAHTGPTWTRDAGDVPLDAQIAGEIVTATNIDGLAEDDFSTAGASSWGTADVGGAWTSSGGAAGDYNVTSGRGTHTMTSVNVSRRSFLNGSFAADLDFQADIQSSALATGASITGALIARYTDVDNMYMARLAFTTTQTVVLTIRKRVASVETVLATFTTGITHAANTDVRLRFKLDGTSLKARAWLPSSPEPEFWMCSTTDSSFTGQEAPGCRSLLETGNTNVSPLVRYDNFVITNPTRWTVTRSVNDVVKAQSAGADISLAQPMTIALN